MAVQVHHDFVFQAFTVWPFSSLQVMDMDFLAVEDTFAAEGAYMAPHTQESAFFRGQKRRLRAVVLSGAGGPILRECRVIRGGRAFDHDMPFYRRPVHLR